MHAQQKPAETSSGSAEWPSRSPPTISLPRGGGAIRGRAPLLGEHTEAILAEIGYSTAEVARLRESGVV